MKNSQWVKGLFYGLCGGSIGLFILFVISVNPNIYGNFAEWFGAIGTIGAVWLAVSYRRAKLNFDVDAAIRVRKLRKLPSNSDQYFEYKPELQIDIFNVNDPSVMIKDIEIVIKNRTRISHLLEDKPIVIKGFEAKRLETKSVSNLITNMEDYKILKKQDPKINVILFGDDKRTFDIRFINEDGAE